MCEGCKKDILLQEVTSERQSLIRYGEEERKAFAAEGSVWLLKGSEERGEGASLWNA